jgi:hypothetical protein
MIGKGFEQSEIDDLGNFWILPRGVNRNKSAKHPREYLSEVPDAELEKALIDRSLLDYRSYRTFTRTRRTRMVEKLREMTGLSSKAFDFLQDAAEPSLQEVEAQ